MHAVSGYTSRFMGLRMVFYCYLCLFDPSFDLDGYNFSRLMSQNAEGPLLLLYNYTPCHISISNCYSCTQCIINA